MIKTIRTDTPLGEMVAGATEKGLCLLEFSDNGRAERECRDLKKMLGMEMEEGENEHLMELRKQLREYFEGTRQAFSVAIITPGTDFQKAVWQKLTEIPYGETRSYRDQAAALGRTNSVRAVANTNGMNRISILIPCHRVIGSNGRLTGYGGGLKRKSWLLDHERKYSGKPVEMQLFSGNYTTETK